MENSRGLPFIIFMLCLSLTGCKKQQFAEADPGTIEIVVKSGANQKADVGTRLLKPIVIGVQYAGGVPISFTDVAFKTADGKVSPAQAKTLQEGTVDVDWTLGKTVGRQTLQVIVKNQRGEQVVSKRINATGLALIMEPTGTYTGTALFRQTGFISDPPGKPLLFLPNYVSFNLKTQGNKITGTVSLVQNNSVPFLPGETIYGLTWNIKVTGTLTGKKIHLFDDPKSALIDVNGTLSANDLQIAGKIKRWPKSKKPDQVNFKVLKISKK